MRRTLEVFEHEPITIGDGGLTPHEFDALVRWNDRSRTKYFRVGHRHLRTRHFVGYMQVGDVGIEILPKADRTAAGDTRPWREGLTEMLRTASMNLEALQPASQTLVPRSLLELVARAFLAEVERLLREGLAKGYRTTESNGPVFRGRLKVAEHLRANLTRADRVYVEHSVFDPEVLLNRVVLGALHVLSWCALPDELSRRIDACVAQFPDLSVAGIDAAAADRVHLGRGTQRYAQALVYARLILAHQGPGLRHGGERVFALLFDMDRLWERFVAVLLRRAAPPGLFIETQASMPFWVPELGDAHQVRPDIVVTDTTGAARLVVDTKWKVPEDHRPAAGDLKQMFVYNELLDCPRAWLLYPATTGSRAVRGTFDQCAHGCDTQFLGVIDGEHWRSSDLLVDQLRGMMQRIAASAPPSGDRTRPRAARLR